VSHEETFERDLTDLDVLGREIDSMAARVGERLRKSAFSGRTVTLKLRRYDFTTLTRSQTLPQPTDDTRTIATTARRLLVEAGTQGGLRLLGVGVSGLSVYAQGDLFAEDLLTAGDAEPLPDTVAADDVPEVVLPETAADEDLPAERRWWPGQDVRHEDLGHGWVWGRGLGRVTVRFEGPRTAPGPVRTLAADDPLLQPAEPPDWR
jgi:DNA polymerase IV